MNQIVLVGGDEIGDLRFMGIANDEGDTRKGGDFFGGALCIAAGDENFGGGILRVDFADGIAGLCVCCGGDGAGVNDHKFGVLRRRCSGAAAVEELALDGGAVGLCGAAAELFDVERRHGRQTI